MLLAAFPDIHASKHALEAVLRGVRRHEPDQVVCLGDLVGYRAFPNEVIGTIRAAGIPRASRLHQIAAVARQA